MSSSIRCKVIRGKRVCKRVFGGLSGPPEEHRREAQLSLTKVNRLAGVAREHASAGRCLNAVGALLNAYRRLGAYEISTGHTAGEGLPDWMFEEEVEEQVVRKGVVVGTRMVTEQYAPPHGRDVGNQIVDATKMVIGTCFRTGRKERLQPASGMRTVVQRDIRTPAGYARSTGPRTTPSALPGTARRKPLAAEGSKARRYQDLFAKYTSQGMNQTRAIMSVMTETGIKSRGAIRQAIFYLPGEGV